MQFITFQEFKTNNELLAKASLPHTPDEVELMEAYDIAILADFRSSEDAEDAYDEWLETLPLNERLQQRLARIKMALHKTSQIAGGYELALTEGLDGTDIETFEDGLSHLECVTTSFADEFDYSDLDDDEDELASESVDEAS